MFENYALGNLHNFAKGELKNTKEVAIMLRLRVLADIYVTNIKLEIRHRRDIQVDETPYGLSYLMF